jgi:hypothetical protein
MAKPSILASLGGIRRWKTRRSDAGRVGHALALAAFFKRPQAEAQIGAGPKAITPLQERQYNLLYGCDLCNVRAGLDPEPPGSILVRRAPE